MKKLLLLCLWLYHHFERTQHSGACKIFTVLCNHFYSFFCPLLESRVLWTNCPLLLYQLTGSSTPNPSHHIYQMDKWSKINRGEGGKDGLQVAGLGSKERKLASNCFPAVERDADTRMVNAYNFLLAPNVCRSELLPQHPRIEGSLELLICPVPFWDSESWSSLKIHLVMQGQ